MEQRNAGVVHRACDYSRLYIFGAGGSGREVAWLAAQLSPRPREIMFLVDDPAYLVPSVNSLPVQLLSDEINTADSAFVAAIGDSQLRRIAVAACVQRGLKPAILVHPRAEISPWVEVADGVIVCAGSVVTTNVTIGEHVQINVSCSISHDVVIGGYSTLSPGVHIAGHVKIGSDVFIGTGANVINGRSDRPLTIGDGAVIAAGACVTKSVDSGALVAGVPAERKR